MRHAESGRPLVSVITAAYGRPEVLQWALDSVRRQTLQDWELLVVGDACDAATADLVQAHAVRDPRIHFTNLQSNYGEQSGPNNVGVARTHGRYVAFLNQDDLWFPDHLAQLVDWLEASGSDIVNGLSFHFGPMPAGATFGQPPWPSQLCGFGHDGHFDPLSTFSPASAWLMRRQSTERIGPWRPALECRTESSQEFLYRAWRAGLRMTHCRVPTVLVMSSGARPGSYTSGMDHEQAELTRHLQLDAARLRSLLLLNTNTIAPPYVGGPAPSAWRRWVWTRLARLGLHPRALAMREQGMRRRGAYIHGLRAMRGLPPALAAEASIEQQRTASVLAFCDCEADETISFDVHGHSWRHRGRGWSQPEATGCWTDGAQASIYLRPRPTPGMAKALALDLRAFTTRRHRRQRLTLLLNGLPVLDVSFQDDAPHTLRIPLPSQPLDGNGLLHLELRLPDAVRACQVKRRSQDIRQLGIQLRSLTICT